MPRLRPLLAGLVLALVGCLGAEAAGAAPGGAELALAAGAFTDSVGVSLHPADAGFALAERLDAAGIHHVRGPAATGPDDPALPGLRALAGAGLQLDLVAG